MKEISIEEKAKAYDEAIEKIQKYVKDDYGCTRLRPEDIFPELKELKESDDEKIRKSIIEFVKQNKSFHYLLGVSKEDAITWLEKQGEHTDIPADAVLDSNKDGLIADTIRRKREKQDEQKSVTDLRTWKYIADYVVTKWCGIGQYLDTPRLATIAEELQKKYSLKQKQGEQKPINIVTILDDYFANTPKEQQDKDWEELKHLNNFGWELVKQKSAEWSKEDEWCFEQIDFLIRNSYSVKDYYKKLSDWFKSIRTQKNNWERVTKEIYFKEPVLIRRKDKSDSWEGYRVCNYHTLDPQTDECYIRIKDINNKKQWKPSEEEMKALEFCLEYIFDKNGVFGSNVVNLYDELKKLREDKL